MFHIKNDMDSSTCCLCLSQDETTFHSNSVMKSRPLHELVHFCIGIQVRPCQSGKFQSLLSNISSKSVILLFSVDEC